MRQREPKMSDKKGVLTSAEKHLAKDKEGTQLIFNVFMDRVAKR